MNKISLKHTFNHLAGQLVIIGLLSLSVSCKDDPAKLGGDGVLPEGDEITAHSYNKHALDSRSVKQDSVLTSDAVYGIIGSFEDPEFGRSKADFLVDFSLAKKVEYSGIIVLDENNVPDTVTYNQFNNGDEWTIDSLVLNLQYSFNNWYGDMRAEHNIKIFELDMPLGSSDEKYYSNLKSEEISIKAIPIAEKIVNTNDDIPTKYRSDRWNGESLWDDTDLLWGDPVYLWDTTQVRLDYENETITEGRRDTIIANSQAKVKNWSFKLDDDLAERIFNLSENELSNSQSFKGAFNGIYVTSDVTTHSEGSLTKVNLLTGSTPTSKLVLHTKRTFKAIFKDVNDNDSIGTDVKTYQYEFPINRENARINRYEHPDLETHSWHDNPKAEKMYLQGMAGYYAQLQLPDELMTWVDSLKNEEVGVQSKTVSNIEFFLKVANHEEVGRYPIPDRLTIYMRNDNDEIVGPPRYTRLVNGNELELEIFGSNIQDNSTGQTAGTGEKKIYASITTENETQIDSIKYQFVMRAEYFNYIMRKLADIEHEQGLSKEELLKEYKKEFANTFYIGPDAGTADFDRVILHSAAQDNKDEDRLKMNIKYFEYIPK